VRLILRSYQTEVPVYIDTGFDGYLIVPVNLTQELGEPDYISRWELGDGSLIECQDYAGNELLTQPLLSLAFYFLEKKVFYLQNESMGSFSG
jgi:hypothetical protein